MRDSAHAHAVARRRHQPDVALSGSAPLGCADRHHHAGAGGGHHGSRLLRQLLPLRPWVAALDRARLVAGGSAAAVLAPGSLDPAGGSHPPYRPAGVSRPRAPAPQRAGCGAGMSETPPSNAYAYETIDDVIHGRVRLAIVAYLASVDRAEFTILRDVVKATDGNLSIHLRKLEDAGYVAVDKRFVDRKPQSLYALTPGGREAFRRYVDRLAGLLGTEKPR